MYSILSDVTLFCNSAVCGQLAEQTVPTGVATTRYQIQHNEPTQTITLGLDKRKYSQKFNNSTCLQPEDDESLLVQCFRGAQSFHLQGEAFQLLGVLHAQDGCTVLPHNLPFT